MRYKFNEIFSENKKGYLLPLRKIRVGGVSLGPGVELGPNAIFGSINFYEYKGHDLEVEDQDEILVIKGIY